MRATRLYLFRWRHARRLLDVNGWFLVVNLLTTFWIRAEDMW